MSQLNKIRANIIGEVSGQRTVDNDTTVDRGLATKLKLHQTEEGVIIRPGWCSVLASRFQISLRDSVWSGVGWWLLVVTKET